MEEEVKIQEQSSDNKPARDELGRLLPGNCGNPNGRPPDTPEQKIVKKAVKELIAEYKEKLAEALPVIGPVLIQKAQDGDLGSIKEINDRVMGKAEQKTDLTSGGEKIIPIPIINVIPANNSDNQDNEPVQAVENSPGGNIGKQDNLNPDLPDSVGPDGQKPDADQHSVGELPAPKEGSGEGLSSNNEGAPILPRQELGQN